MSIAVDLNVFPFNALTLIVGAMEDIDSSVTVVERPLRSSDPNMTIGVFPVLWQPMQSSLEIGHMHHNEPTVQEYVLSVQGFVKHGDKDIGLATSTQLARLIRMTLYRSLPLRVALEALSVNDGISQERYLKATIRNQQFMNNQIKTQFAFLSVLDLLLETETV